MPLCGKCKAKIEFYPNMATGRPMPLDAQPNERGNVELVEHNGKTWARVIPMAELEDDGVASDPEDNAPGCAPKPRGPRFLSHFASCSEAAFYRSKGKA